MKNVNDNDCWYVFITRLKANHTQVAPNATLDNSTPHQNFSPCRYAPPLCENLYTPLHCAFCDSRFRFSFVLCRNSFLVEQPKSKKIDDLKYVYSKLKSFMRNYSPAFKHLYNTLANCLWWRYHTQILAVPKSQIQSHCNDRFFTSLKKYVTFYLFSKPRHVSIFLGSQTRKITLAQLEISYKCYVSLEKVTYVTSLSVTKV